MKIALQMDAIGSINIDSDTTFALALEAQNRGHELYYYQPQNLSLKAGEAVANIQKITLYNEKNNHFALKNATEELLKDMDVILMRQDPPFDMNYLTYTYLLDKIHPKTLVVNNPTEVRNCPEKIFVCDFAKFIPPTLISADKNTAEDFLNQHVDIILKPLYAHGGQDVNRVNKDNFAKTFDELLGKYKTPIIAQKFIANVTKGDKRIILIDGEVAGAVNRIPPEGEILSNFVQGGTGQKTTLTKRENEICKVLKPELKKRGLILTGIDVIDGYLTEINVTSPTGIQSINRLDGVKLEEIFWNVVEKKING